ncbi:major capsid protein [Serratia sp. MF2]|uniref:major capsid protein n=1 Tax=Serratia sp. MF1(2023) TaxID=3059171 RepID=UPI0027F579AF|nr:major capsid protein [Serratia sp. MF1(2023)]MDQ7104202.1 major capsid protein [Serratia sp. MF1(2023)]
MADNKVDLYQPRMLVAALHQAASPRRFLMKTFFKNIKTHDTKTVDLDIRKGKRTVAAIVHPLHNGKVVERAGFTTNTVHPAYTKELIPMRPGDTVSRAFGEDYSTPLTPQQRAARILGEDLSELDDRLTRREEVMAAQALFNGKVHVLGEGLDFEVDFGYEQDRHLITLSGSDTWDSGGDPMRDLDNWSRATVARCGLKPDIAIMGKNVSWAVLDNEKVKERLDIRNFFMGAMGPVQSGAIAEEEDGVTWHGRLAPSNIDLYTYDELWLNPLTGEEEPLIPDDAIFLGSTRAGCLMQYGLIQNMYALGSMPRFPLSWTENNGSARWLQLESAPMPNPYQVDAFTVARVLSD